MRGGCGYDAGMFTGIIQDVGRIVTIEPEPDQTHMTFSTALETSNWQLGDSVAVDGCCLTVTAMPASDRFSATLSRETLNFTGFGDAREGARVNLEPALRMGDALGGHMVSGHIDGVATVSDIKEIGEHRELSFEMPQPLARYVVGKGSVAINGVSLTVNRVEGSAFTVNLIPHTLSHTNLGELETGDWVNIETDMLGRYVERLMQCREEQETTA